MSRLDCGGQHKKITSDESRWGCISLKGIQLEECRVCRGSLGEVLADGKHGQRHFESCSWRLAESEAKKGALPPLRSPFSNLGQHASCRDERKSSVRAVRKAVRSRNSRILKRFTWRFSTISLG